MAIPPAPAPAPAGAVHLAVRPDWLARHTEPALDPELPIVDPHHHLWDHQLWGRTVEPYLFPQLLEDTNSGHNIVATVFIECRSMYRASGPEAFYPVGETEFVNGVAAMSASGGYGNMRACAGIVGHANLCLGAPAREVLEALIRAGGGHFRGIRHITAYDSSDQIRSAAFRPPPGLLMDKTFREGFAQLAPLNLSFDAWMFHHQLHELTDLARAFPATQIVMNHIGGPIGIGPYANDRKKVFSDWSAAIRELSTCPNVTAKLGGMAMRVMGFDFGDRPEPPTSQQLADAWRPHIETVISAFGPKRCMFESNFPVDKGMCSYQVIWNAFKHISAGASADERAELFRRTAARFYRLDGLE